MAAPAPFDSEQCDGAVTRFAPASSSGIASHFFARWRVEPEIVCLLRLTEVPQMEASVAPVGPGCHNTPCHCLEKWPTLSGPTRTF